MGLVKKQWEKIEEDKIRNLKKFYGEEYYNLRPIEFVGDEEHFLSPNNIRFIYNVMTHKWVVEL